MKKLTKSNNKMIAGVCAGLADYIEVDPTVMRIVYVILTFFTAAFPGILVYLLLCLLMPSASDETLTK